MNGPANESLRVAAFVSAFPRTTESFIARQARLLPALVCTTERTDEPVDIAGIQVVRLPASSTTVVGTRARILRLARRARGASTTVLSRPAAREWANLLYSLRPDVVLVHFGFAAQLVAPGCVSVAVPYVVHFHGIDLSAQLRSRDYVDDLRRLASTAAGFVVVSGSQERRLREIVGDGARIERISYGVPTDEFSPRGDVGAEPCRFLAVGRLVPKKAPDLTVRAFARMARAVPTARLDIVGDGPLRSDVRRVAEELGVAARVHIHGERPNEFVRRMMRGPCVFVQHSRRGANGDEEGWPVSIGEAAASGLPVVATRHAGIPDQVVDNESGFLVDEGDHDGMGARMAQLAHSPELRRRMGARARRHMLHCGDLSIQVAALREFLRQAAETRPTRCV